MSVWNPNWTGNPLRDCEAIVGIITGFSLVGLAIRGPEPNPGGGSVVLVPGAALAR